MDETLILLLLLGKEVMVLQLVVLVCLFVCLLATLLKMLSMDVILWRGKW